MKKLITILLFIPLFANAQNTFKAIVKDSLTNEPLVGSSGILKGTTIGSSVDLNGKFEIKNIPNGKQTIVFSFIGYENLEITYTFPINENLQEHIIYLKPKTEKLEEVVVTSTRTNSRIENIPIRVEVIGKEEVDEEVNIKPTNISKLLLESTSIQSQQTSAITGNVSIRLLGLDGKYTQILKDGFPLYSGFAQGLSVLEIPPLDLKQVEIIKGSSSSLYGSDAIAGIINLISKQPQRKRELTFLVNQTSLQGTDANRYFSQRWKKVGFSVLATSNFQNAEDVNKDGFSDLPKTLTIGVAPTFYYYLNSTTTLLFGLNGTFDKRKGGDMEVLKNQPSLMHQYFEENISNRISTQMKFDKQFENGKSLTFKNSISYFDRAINQPASTFKGNQMSSYTEASFNFRIAKHQFVSGIDVITEKFSEDTTKSHQQRNYNYITTGFFLQDDWNPFDKVTLQAGVRTDYQNQFGIFVLPRLAIMYKFSKEFYVRAGSGFGYKVPSIFSTESEQEGINLIQPLSTIIKAEKSIGANLDFNYKKQFDGESMISINQSFFATQIDNPLVLDTIRFINKNKPIFTKGFESNLRLVLDEFQLFVGYTFIDARRKYDTTQSFIPLTPKHKVNVDIIYEDENNYSLAIEGYYLSPMFRDQDLKTKDYFTIGLIAQKHFKHCSIIANCDNIFDVQQTRFENIVNPPASAPTFRQIYAPLSGRVFSVALRIKI
ncbi:MAG: TonB-dependent receptor [Bacteroidales bacterium]|nr:TonB-dependent receptor [Bacteroidales bacterium]